LLLDFSFKIYLLLFNGILLLFLWWALLCHAKEINHFYYPYLTLQGLAQVSSNARTIATVSDEFGLMTAVDFRSGEFSI